MKVTLREKGVTLSGITSASWEVTKYLDMDSTAAITAERDKTRDERVAGDFDLTFSDMDGFFSAIMQDRPGSTEWWVDIEDSGRILFCGNVHKPSIDFSFKDLKVSLTVLHPDKIFWQRAKSAPVKREPYSPNFAPLVYIYLADALNWNILYSGYFTDLITKLDIPVKFLTRKIRAFAITTDPNITNRGMMRYLSTKTTVHDFLKACEVYYNAEFFIDTGTTTLMMRERFAQTGIVHADADANLRDDGPVRFRPQAEEVYSHMYLSLTPVAPIKPKIVGTAYQTNADAGMNATNQYWGLTQVVTISATQTVETEIGASESGNFIDISGKYHYVQVWLQIPAATYPNVVERRLYRYFWVPTIITPGGGGPPITVLVPKARLVAIIPGALLTAYWDAHPDTPIPSEEPPEVSIYSGKAFWISYREGIGWSVPIIDDGKNTVPVTANVLKIGTLEVDLTFVDAAGTELAKSATDGFLFFGAEYTTPQIMDNYIDYFIPARVLTVPMKEINHAVGDAYPFTRLPKQNGTYVCRKAQINLKKEEADLEVVLR